MIDNQIRIKNEEEIAGLIQFLGDITIKSTAKRETEAVKFGIDKLSKIALQFLELKIKNEEQYKVANESFLVKTDSKNQFIGYVVDELGKIFAEALKQKDVSVSRHVISTLNRILHKTFVGKNNWPILEKLIDTRNVLGSTYTQMMTYSLQNGTSLENNLITGHLVSIPQFAIMEGKYDLRYVESFVDYHIYRMAKIIITGQNYQAFSDLLEHFFNSLHFKDPVDIARRLEGDIYMTVMGLISPEVTKKLEEISFFITKLCLKDFQKIPQIADKLDELQTIAISISKFEDNSDIETRIQRLKTRLSEFFISSLVHAVFVRIGVLLLSKGDAFAQYVEDLWYHGKSTQEGVNIINSTPISDSIEWLTYFTLYEGNSSSLSDYYMFENFQNAEEYHYQYLALMMVKQGRVFSLPMDRIEKIKNQDSTEEFAFYYEIVHSLHVKKITDALKKIETNQIILSIIRTVKVKDNIKTVKNQLEELESNRQKALDLLSSHGKVNPARLAEVKTQILEKYFKDSITDKTTIIEYNPNLSDENLIEKKTYLSLPRDFFIEQDFIARFLTQPSISELAHNEMEELLKILQTTDAVKQDTIDFVEQIKSNIRVLKDRGKNPNVIFIPLNVEMELMMKGLLDFRNGRKLKVDDIEIDIINSWKRLDFTDIIIYDSKSLSFTYKAETKDSRITVNEIDIKEGDKAVQFLCKTTFSIKIIDPMGFRRIVNENVIALNEKKSGQSRRRR